MSWIKKIIIALLALLVLFAFAKYYVVEEVKKETIEKELSFPIEDIFLQYSNLQNFVRWNEDVLDTKELFITYYEPYQGEGSSMSYRNEKGTISGELSIEEEKKYSYIKYRYFKDFENPLYIKVLFQKMSENRTKVTYVVEKPSKTLLDKVINYWKAEPTFFVMDKELDKLGDVLSNKVDKEHLLEDIQNIKFDSIMIEHQNEQILLGNHFSVLNKNGMKQKNIFDNISQIEQYVQVVLDKKEDEFGFPLIIIDDAFSKGKEFFYYAGIPLSETGKLEDKRYGFRTLEASDVYVMYYQGHLEDTQKPIRQLINKVQKDSLRYGSVQQVILQQPNEEGKMIFKIALPIVK